MTGPCPVGASRPGPPPPRRSTRSRRRRRPPAYAELHAASSFSFLAGASAPEELIERAAALELPAVALIDRNGVYGAPRFYRAAKQAGVRALVGAEVVLADEGGLAGDHPGHGPLGLVPEPEPRSPSPAPDPARLTLLVAEEAGYRNLCRLLTAAARGKPKGEAAADWETIAAHAGGLVCLTGGDEGPLSRRLFGGNAGAGPEAARRWLERLRSSFGDRLYCELQRHGRQSEEHRNGWLIEEARRLGLPLLATNGVRYAGAGDKALLDVLTCIREKTHLDAAGSLLDVHRQSHLKGGAEMARLFADQPAALAGAGELAERLDFTLADLGYRFPDYPLPPGESAASYLRHITWNCARSRLRPLTARAQAQLEKELAVIEKLGLAGYFLIVWDIVRFCQREGIMAQGRGSAANSAVCYALSITAVDPVKMDLLFERFLSEERGEWPDIDLDLPSGEQREKVIQYVYRRYGPHGAAMTANVITYRDRSATREVAKALGFSAGQIDKLAKQLKSLSYDRKRGDDRELEREIAAAGFDPAERRVQLFCRLWHRIHHHPRHLGQHSGGMVVAAGRLDEVVPLEPSAMPERTVVQWDKEDCADLGIIKIDLLGLGMLNALEEAVPLVRVKERVNLDLAHLPVDDPKTFDMIRKADTVGVFQIESRAQMASLPRNDPQRFYDLVVQVAIIRPGPITGGMVQPFFERRLGRQEVTYLHPSLEPILKRTLGVPIFQEQILRIAMTAAGFTGGEAEELRRAMGFKRSRDAMEVLEQRLRRGMARRGITGTTQDQIIQSITSFALYGFPESHAASFALIAYASAYLKAHHPTAFYVSLLNAWPMGFYHPATLIQDAQRHGVEVRPIDVQRSGWRCRWEANEADGTSGAGGRSGGRSGGRAGGRGGDRRKGKVRGALRLGMRYVRGLRRASGETVEAEQRRRPFTGVDDLLARCTLRQPEVEALAEAGALACFGVSRREALWQVAWLSRGAGPLFDDQPSAPSPLPEMSPLEETLADYATQGLTAGRHPLAYYRRRLAELGVTPAADLERRPDGSRVKIAGAVIVRQRPGTAKGILFMTLEDESGMVQAIVQADQLKQHRPLLVGSAGLIVEGRLQRRDGTLSVKAERFGSLSALGPPSHDFR